jgi:5'-3' exoribonuclease 1
LHIRLHSLLRALYPSLYKLVQPRKVLYLAVDGVAPRAKMNQQRSRRFRSAKDAETTTSEIIARGGSSQLELESLKRFDSNCITPGTDFMLKLSLAMQKVRQRTHTTNELSAAPVYDCAMITCAYSVLLLFLMSSLFHSCMQFRWFFA